MGLSVENLIVAIVLILPGFLSAGIRARYEPGGDAMSVSWLGLCLLRSLAFNLLLVLPFSWFAPEIRNATLLDTAKTAKLPPDIGAGMVLAYGLLLYSIAFLWGHAPVVPLLRRILDYLQVGGSIAPETSVFRETLVALRMRPRRHGLLTTLGGKLARDWGRTKDRVPNSIRRRLKQGWREIVGIVGPLSELDPGHDLWLMVRRSDGRRIVGKIMKTSSTIEAGTAFEALLYPAAEVDKLGELVAPAIAPDVSPSGFYFRVQPGDEVFFYKTAPDWLPTQLATGLSVPGTSSA